MDNKNMSLAEMPDELFEDEDGKRIIIKDLMNGDHEEVFLHMNTNQLSQLLAYMQSTGVFFGDDYHDGLDTPKDFLTHMHKFTPEQYVGYVLLATKLSEEEE